MGNDAIGYFFIILLVLIAAPLVFWIGSVFYAWILWLFRDRKKLNESYSSMVDIENPIRDSYTLSYKIGTASIVKLSITDVKFNVLKQLFSEEKTIGMHHYELNTKELSNGKYFIQLTTNNQKLTKQIIIDN